jgi:hypothetical protein
MVVATIVIAFATCTYTKYAREQWKVMSGTLNEMETSGAMAKNQIDSMITETNRIADSVENSLKQSKTALDATIKASELDQRAWVGVLKITPATFRDKLDNLIYLKKDSQPTFKVIITNSGKSPATKVKNYMRFKTFPAKVKFSFSPIGSDVAEQSISVIQPQGTLHMPVQSSDIIITCTIDTIESGKCIPYLFGIITYEDIFKNPHKTIFCLYLAPSLDQFIACDKYNTAD